MMVMPPMQSISGDDDGTYASHMVIVPLTAGMLGLPCRPCSGPHQLIVGDYSLEVAILPTFSGSGLHFTPPFFYYADFCSRSVWE
jgi:hypothetical protein